MWYYWVLYRLLFTCYKAETVRTVRWWPSLWLPARGTNCWRHCVTNTPTGRRAGPTTARSCTHSYRKVCTLYTTQHLYQNILYTLLQVGLYTVHHTALSEYPVHTPTGRSVHCTSHSTWLRISCTHSCWKVCTLYITQHLTQNILYTLLQEGLYTVHNTLVSEYPVHTPTGKSVHCTPHSTCLRISCTHSCRNVCILYTTQHLSQNILYTLLQEGLYTVHHTALDSEYSVHTPAGRSVQCTLYFPYLSNLHKNILFKICFYQFLRILGVLKTTGLVSGDSDLYLRHKTPQNSQKLMMADLKQYIVV